MEHKKCSKPPTSLIHLEVKPCKNHGFAVQIVSTKISKSNPLIHASSNRCLGDWEIPVLGKFLWFRSSTTNVINPQLPSSVFLQFFAV